MKAAKLCCALALATAATHTHTRSLWANVYAAHLQPAANTWNFSQDGPLTLSYRLNEPATNATVEIYRAGDPGTIIKSIAGTTSYGVNQVVWDGTDTNGQPVVGAGDYKFRVIAQDAVGHAIWTNITPLEGGNEIGSAQFRAPEGVVINREPNSPYFGRIYISNGNSALPSVNPGATAVGDGLFMLNSDMSFLGGSAAMAAAAANAQLVTSTASDTSPWKLNINIDNPDEIVMCDFTDGFENVWIFSGDGATVFRVLNASTNGPTTGAAFNHGNAICAGLSGVGPARKLWVLDEDKDVGTPWVVAGAPPDFVRFDIGDTLVNYSGPGTEIINAGATLFGARAFYTGREFQFGRRDVDGSFRMYCANRRANNSDPNLAAVCYTIGTEGLVTGSPWNVPNPTLSTGTGTTWTLSSSLAVDEARKRVAVGRDTGTAGTAPSRVAILNSDDGSYVTFFESSAGNATLRSLDFDAAGNLYTADIGEQRIRMWSPPDGPNSFTTPYHGRMAINCASPPPTILEGPISQQVCPGTPFSFTVTADGHGASLSYEWRKGLTVVGTGPTLSFASVSPADAGVYTVTVTGCSSVTSEPATLTVIGAPTITQQPASIGIYAGEDAVFEVSASGGGQLSYQWKRTLGNETIDVGTNAPSLTLENVPVSLHGAKITVHVTDLTCGVGSTTTVSNEATLNVVQPPCSSRFADTDGDTDVDQEDFGVFQVCFSGAAPADLSQCKCLDRVEPFGSIDAADYLAFEACFSGPAVPASTTCGATITFEADFEKAPGEPASTTDPDWTVRGTATGDYTLLFGYDYSVHGIPPAPNSAGPTTRGLFASVNDIDNGEAGTTNEPLEAVLAYTNQTFSGDYTVQFDMWLQYGGGGTTEFALMGVNGEIPEALNAPTAGAAAGASIGAAPTGYLFAVDPEAGDNFRDYRTYENSVELLGLAGGYLDGIQDSTVPTSVFASIFPAPKNVFLGVPGNTDRLLPGTPAGWGWARVEIQRKGDILTWKMNDVPVASLSATAAAGGRAMLGHQDHYASINDKLTFVVFDNFRVIEP